MHLSRRTLFAILLAILCCSCAHQKESQSVSETFKGYFTKGFEISVFAPVGERQLWWVTGEVNPLLRAVTSEDGLVGGTVYTEIIGTLSSPGSYGHLGAYNREIIVQRVLSIQKAEQGAAANP